MIQLICQKAKGSKWWQQDVCEEPSQSRDTHPGATPGCLFASTSQIFWSATVPLPTTKDFPSKQVPWQIHSHSGIQCAGAYKLLQNCREDPENSSEPSHSFYQQVKQSTGPRFFCEIHSLDSYTSTVSQGHIYLWGDPSNQPKQPSKIWPNKVAASPASSRGTSTPHALAQRNPGAF